VLIDRAGAAVAGVRTIQIGTRSSAADAGGNPDDVGLRSEGTVEGYLQ